jgi:hypothetical protein
MKTDARRERRSTPPWSRDERVLHGRRLGSSLRLGYVNITILIHPRIG